jgi:hypothetical protein
VPRFRVQAHAEYFYTATVEADDVDRAEQMLIQKIRDESLKPLSGPGISRIGTYRIVDGTLIKETDDPGAR